MARPVGWRFATARRLSKRSGLIGKSTSNLLKFRTPTIGGSVAIRTAPNRGLAGNVTVPSGWKRSSPKLASRSCKRSSECRNACFERALSSRGNPPNQAFLLALALCSDGERVQYAERECVFQSLVRTRSQVALTENLHPNNGFSRRFHFTQNTDDSVRIRIHVRPDGIDAHQVNFNPTRFRRSAQGLDAVTRTTVCANNTFLLGFGKHVHHTV